MRGSDVAALSTPLLRAKSHDQSSLFEPEKLVREARRQLGLPAGSIPPVVVLDPDGDLLRHVASTRGVAPVAQWSCYHSEMSAAVIGGVHVGIVPSVVGGPYAVLVAEQAFVSGCQLLIDLTSAGRVTPLEQTAPYFVLVDKAWRDEGTSLHYLPPSEWAFLAPALSAELHNLPAMAGGQPVLRGASWTTDAPYRETPDALAAAQHVGILAVEMEAASLYAFATARNREVLCVAHVTNDVAATETADFEKGEHGGAVAALHLLDQVVSILAAAGHARTDAAPTPTEADGGPSAPATADNAAAFGTADR
jgi:uridine phosphorylase